MKYLKIILLLCLITSCNEGGKTPITLEAKKFVFPEYRVLEVKKVIKDSFEIKLNRQLFGEDSLCNASQIELNFLKTEGYPFKEIFKNKNVDSISFIRGCKTIIGSQPIDMVDYVAQPYLLKYTLKTEEEAKRCYFFARKLALGRGDFDKLKVGLIVFLYKKQVYFAFIHDMHNEKFDHFFQFISTNESIKKCHFFKLDFGLNLFFLKRKQAECEDYIE